LSTNTPQPARCSRLARGAGGWRSRQPVASRQPPCPLECQGPAQPDASPRASRLAPRAHGAGHARLPQATCSLHACQAQLDGTVARGAWSRALRQFPHHRDNSHGCDTARSALLHAASTACINRRSMALGGERGRTQSVPFAGCYPGGRNSALPLHKQARGPPLLRWYRGADPVHRYKASSCGAPICRRSTPVAAHVHALTPLSGLAGAHKGLTTRQRQQISLKEGVLAPIFASISLFGFYLLIKYLPDLGAQTPLESASGPSTACAACIPRRAAKPLPACGVLSFTSVPALQTSASCSTRTSFCWAPLRSAAPPCRCCGRLEGRWARKACDSTCLRGCCWTRRAGPSPRQDCALHTRHPTRDGPRAPGFVAWGCMHGIAPPFGTGQDFLFFSFLGGVLVVCPCGSSLCAPLQAELAPTDLAAVAIALGLAGFDLASGHSSFTLNNLIAALVGHRQIWTIGGEQARERRVSDVAGRPCNARRDAPAMNATR
jgi:hypothetical protein